MRTAFLVALLLLIKYSPSAAQETTGRVAGRVVTQDGAPLAEVGNGSDPGYFLPAGETWRAAWRHSRTA